MYNKILVINLMYIGDLLFCTPLLRVLRRQFPSADIVMLADKKNSDVIRYNPNISELIAIDKKGYHNKLPNYLRLIGDIRRRKFDLVINLHPNERASAIAAFSGAHKIIGLSAKGFSLFFDHRVKERTDIHQADAYLEVLREIDISNFKHNGLEMWVDKHSQGKADTLWQEVFKDFTAPVIGLNTGGSWPTKRWTRQGFAELADRLLADGYGIAFFGGPMDKEDVNDILNMMKSPYRKNIAVAVFTGETSLLEMAALAKKCRVFVTGDSGPMHIAVSQKVPVVAIFGPSDPVRYHPYGQADSVLRANCECMPCGRHQCDHHRCMQNITVQQVYTAVLSRLVASKFFDSEDN